MKLGKLQEIDIRKVWEHEQYDFSKWLAGEDNIQELGDALNLSLTDVETEKFVGNYAIVKYQGKDGLIDAKGNFYASEDLMVGIKRSIKVK
jgi:hypothetical protein